jgi:uroporphyrinogen decarboxylase
MNSRERFWKWANYEPVDRLPYWSDWLGPWETWMGQGLPASPDEIDDTNRRDWFINHFGFEGMFSAFWGRPRVPVDLGPCPVFEKEVFEQVGDTILYRSGNGVIVRQFSHPGSSLISTEFVDYPIKSRQDWIRYRDEHLDPDAPGRYPDPAEWETMKTKWKDRDYVISIDGGSFYGFLRDWIGFERLSYFLYDDPGLVHDMMDYLADFFIHVLKKAVSEVEIDFALFWEDMCYKSGPLISPDHFRQFMLPNYRKVTKFLEEHGVKLSWVDCDGNIEALLPLWLEGGVRGFYPLEVASGMDAGKLQDIYGRQILMWGNVDKRVLATEKDAIDGELKRLAPLVQRGGLIPLVDHGVPDDVPYANYLYYLEGRKKLSGWE